MEPILRTDAVTKIFETGTLIVRAVDQVSFEIQPGEFVALVGPSGSGKTTMLAMLAGLLNATEGEIHIDGHELGKMSEQEKTRFRREKIGFTFQANNLIPYLTALENVELMLRLNSTNSKFCREEAKKLLGRLGLSDRLNNLPKQLSGGQQQRVAIARALIHDPSLVLADEPTASLDTERAYQVVQIFSELIHEQKRAGIMVTHDLRMTQYVDRVIQMVDGKIYQIIDDRAEIDAMAAGGRFETAKKVEEKELKGGVMGALNPGLAPVRG
ncbi:MAG: ABC transporter ATP-binding protein [Anaerolineales bacterium]|nr:ABC transporter ATP-binding protein [Anaerolineales bacterium]